MFPAWDKKPVEWIGQRLSFRERTFAPKLKAADERGHPQSTEPN